MILFSDIDGTLLDANRELSPATISVVRELHRRGIPMILNSSRSPQQMFHLQKQASIEQLPLIAFNGALVTVGENIIFSQEIPLPVLVQIIDFNQKIEGEKHISLYHQHEWYAPQTDQWTTREEQNTRVKAQILPHEQVLLLWEKQAKGAHKLMIMGEKSYVDTMATFLGGFSSLSCYRSKDTYLEVTHQSVSKLTGVETVLKHYGLTKDKAIAFGDNYNDIPMLQGVGLGVAVGNAKEEVKKAAKQSLTLSHKDDAVAQFLATYFQLST